MHRLIRIGLTSVLATAVLGAGLAVAQDDAEETPAEGTPAEGEGTEATPAEGTPAEGGDAAAADAAAGAAAPHGMTNGKGGINVDVNVEIGLNDGNSGDPVSISPDLWYGVTDKIDVGIIHSTVGRTGFVGVQSGASLCVTGDFLCEALDIYHNIGIEGRMALKQDAKMGLGAKGGLHVNNFDPFAVGLKVGVFGNYTAGKIMIGFDPSIQIGLNERDSGGNEDLLAIPVMAVFNASPKFGVGVQTGLLTPLEEMGDTFTVPLSVGAHFMATEQIGVGGAFTLPRLLDGNDAIGAADARTLSIWVNYRMGGGA